MNGNQSQDATSHEKKARMWDRWTTVAIFILLLVPLPFARFEAWPGGAIISEHIITPWSEFRLCYTDFPSGESVQRVYRFTWRGDLLPRQHLPHVFAITSSDPPLLKWQHGPDIVLTRLFLSGDLLILKTSWQPLLIWPFKMGWRVTPQT